MTIAWTALYECINDCLCESVKMTLLPFDMTAGLRTSILHNHLTTTYFLFNLLSFKNTDMLSYKATNVEHLLRITHYSINWSARLT